MPLTTSTKTSDLDFDFLDLALALAVKGEGQVKPNPPVGALIVRDGIIVGQGFDRYECRICLR
jgi:diaminohydroxyphosphoribosylaminopyrimidine deaminase/5-amino-6-(5-phosphoribosylamino)uracil reductase